jgi:hypothetical protein
VCLHSTTQGMMVEQQQWQLNFYAEFSSGTQQMKAEPAGPPDACLGAACPSTCVISPSCQAGLLRMSCCLVKRDCYLTCFLHQHTYLSMAAVGQPLQQA